MKCIYLANIRLPTEKAHGVQIMNMCEAFAALGHTVELVVSDRKTPISEDPFTYYGIRRSFAITRLPVWDTIGWFGALGFLLESFSFARSAKKYLRDVSYDVLYGRDEIVLACVRAPYVWESHTGVWNVFARKVARNAKKIVVISQGLKDFYISKGVPAEKLVVAHDGVSLEQLAHPEPKEAARTRLGLPHDKSIAMYIGRLDGWKGTGALLESSKLLPENVLLAIIGGEPAEIAVLEKAYPRVRFLGYRPYREIAGNQAAADVLVLPNTGRDPVSVGFTSPLKLFTYMASGKPIVASDLPSIREVVDERSAYLVEPDSPRALSGGIVTATKDGASGARAAHARELVASYTWQARAQRILRALLPGASVAQ